MTILHWLWNQYLGDAGKYLGISFYNSLPFHKGIMTFLIRYSHLFLLHLGEHQQLGTSSFVRKKSMFPSLPFSFGSPSMLWMFQTILSAKHFLFVRWSRVQKILNIEIRRREEGWISHENSHENYYNNSPCSLLFLCNCLLNHKHFEGIW